MPFRGRRRWCDSVGDGDGVGGKEEKRTRQAIDIFVTFENYKMCSPGTWRRQMANSGQAKAREHNDDGRKDRIADSSTELYMVIHIRVEESTRRG